MDSQYLHLNIDFVGNCGIILSPEQKAALQTSLVILRNNQKFSRVQFWGKIIGVQDDYYVAQGFVNDQFSERTTLYSNDCVIWKLLNPPTADTIRKSRLMSGRFTGDASYEAEHKERYISDDGDDIKEETIMLKEEDRLAAVIADIDHDAVIVPRGAFVKTPTGEVYANRNFEGHSSAEAAKLCNYLHFRRAERQYEKTILQRANLERSIDFMDSIDDDIPKGSWSIQFERGSGLVSIKSLQWLGYFFYHVPGTRQYGSVYFGTGELNVDLPFML